MIYCRIDNSFRILGLSSVLDRRFDSSYEFYGESHPFWEAFAVLSGEVEVVEDYRTYHMCSGDIIFHAPGEFHRLKSAGETAPHSITICFITEGNLPPRLSEGVFKMSKEKQEELVKVKDIMFSALGENFSGGFNYFSMAELTLPEEKKLDAMEAVCRLTSFILSICKLEPSEASLSNTAGAREYRKLVRTMTQRVRDNLTLAELASIHHISESYIKKLFRSYAGESPTAYYTRLRTAEACRLLDSGMSIFDVSELLNFSSAAYFSAFFKKQMGECAKDYKRRK